MANTHQYEPPPQSAHTPLTIAAFYTLFALAQGEQHGYAIMQAAKSLSAGAFSMGPATLYPTIARLRQAGLITETSSEKTARELQRGRRFYKITAHGRAAFDEELARMARVIERATNGNPVPLNLA
jgi:DNA-binding PadR family transcriptional regulator